MSVSAMPRRTLTELLATCVWGWPVCLGIFGGGGLWAVSLGMSHGNSVERLGIALLLTAIASAPLFYLLSRFTSTPRRALVYFPLAAALVVPLVVPTFGFFGAGYFVLVPQSPLVQALQWGALTFATAVWVGIDLESLRKRIVAKRYVEREFIELANYVALRWERKTNIDAPPISDRTKLGRLWIEHGLKLTLALAPLASAGYAMSRLVERAGGREVVLLTLAVLGVPLCMHMISKLVCGAYLNIYKVWQIERRTGKPVLFDEIPAE